jgi:DNA invertase Pin-like site-specific DNA recombinase
MTEILAIANCRVSSDEQKLNGSLDRQDKSVQQAARELNAKLVQTWSGSVSSKKGLNVNRKDLDEMLDLCKKNKRIKYVIIDELDRFMRSMLEIGYFLVLFNKLGVKVVFASQPDLKTDTAVDTLLLMLEAYKAEGSNEERQKKSINGQTAALLDGRYTFHPKPGYKKGVISGVHEIHPLQGGPLRYILRKLASGVITPTNALKELNESSFTKNHAPYKMDKFRRIATDPYYAGIISVHKQVQVTNTNGLHEPLISLKEHEKLVNLFNKKPKNQTGPNTKGNPGFPLSNLVSHSTCVNDKNKGRLVGLKLSNGKSAKVYEKYRCRSCKKYLAKEDFHNDIVDLFNKYEMAADTQEKIFKALETTWKNDADRVYREIRNMKLEIRNLEHKILQNVESATDPSNAEIKDDLLKVIANKKDTLSGLKSKLDTLEKSLESDKISFMEFAISFIKDTGAHYLESYISKENRIRCKQLLFPSEIYVDELGKVYTPEISVFYRLAAKKMDTEVSDNSHLVRVQGL